MVRRRTLDTLAEIGPPARALLPAVQEALHDSEPCPSGRRVKTDSSDGRGARWCPGGC
jgi:hypothetical protein